MTEALFYSDLPVLPWLPGETLFSLCSRHHRLWGQSTSWKTTELLFGRRRAGLQHDLPNSLDELAARMDGRFGDAAVIGRHRTLLHYYRPFLPTLEVTRALQSMRSASVAHLKFRLGLVTSRFRANHPLKVCLSCMRKSIDEQGWTYWHLHHQFPGVWVCSQHGERLIVSNLKATGVERFTWQLPNMSHLKEALRSRGAEVDAAAARLAELTICLVSLDAEDGWLEPSAVGAVLRSRLAERGWLTPAGSLRLSAAAADYARHCVPLREVPELLALPHGLDDAKTQLGRLLRPLRSGTHPVRWLTVIDWLFDDAADFIAHRARSIGRDPGGQDRALPHVSKRGTDFELQRRTDLIGRIRAGQSTTSAAASVGIDVTTAMSWAASAGLSTRKRPKLLTDVIRASLTADLVKGVDKIDAAGRHGVSIETVTRFLRTEPGLYAGWQEARAAKARTSARDRWLELQGEHVGWGIKLLRAIGPAAYAWLYRHDRAWLRDHSPSRSAYTAGDHRVRVQWDQRDEALCIEVQKVVVHLVQSNKGRHLRLWQIYQALPDLKPKLASLDRLPLTKRALEAALAARGSSTSADLF